MQSFRREFLPPLFDKFLDAALGSSGNFPHLVLYGPPGTGKSTALQFLKSSYVKLNPNIKCLDLNAAQDDKALDKVMQFVKHAHPIRGQFNLLILEEADYMLRANQAKLRHIIETHTDCVRFLFTCNELHRILSPIQSRCFCFRFAALYATAAHEVTKGMLSVAKGDIRHLKRLIGDPDAVRMRMEESRAAGNTLRRIAEGISFDDWWKEAKRFDMITLIEQGIKLVSDTGKDALVDIGQSFRELRGYDYVTGWQLFHCMLTHKV